MNYPFEVSSGNTTQFPTPSTSGIADRLAGLLAIFQGLEQQQPESEARVDIGDGVKIIGNVSAVKVFLASKFNEKGETPLFILGSGEE